MNYTFISGIPASGKSYLAGKIAKAVGAAHIETDKWREEMKRDNKLRKWVDFFRDKNEVEYWDVTNCNEHWKNIKNQSEAFWPVILKNIKKIQKSGKPAIFEGVNILPHLAAKDLLFPGIFLLGDSYEVVFERNKKDPRWGKTEKLQKKEAEAFFYCERLKYKEEAEKYGFKVFFNIKNAEEELLKIFKYEI